MEALVALGYHKIPIYATVHILVLRYHLFISIEFVAESTIVVTELLIYRAILPTDRANFRVSGFAMFKEKCSILLFTRGTS